jgi:hypothetical protein
VLSLFPVHDVSQFPACGWQAGRRLGKGIGFDHHLCADGFSSTSYTQGGVSDRSSRNYALGYYILAFQA